MKRDDKIQPTIVPLLELNDLYATIIREVQAKSHLKSKYLYLGWHGAKAWKSVDSSYKISAEGLQIINDHFIKIDEIVRSTAMGKKYNIVSLGSGTGEEDAKILDVLLRIYSSQEIIPFFRIYTIDISIDLLIEGAHRLANKVNGHPKLKKSVQDIIPINIDFEQLQNPKAKQVIYNYKSKKKETNLFHLLGLTLGNNEETTVLNSIYRSMNFGDYLLLSVDFCADNTKILDQTKEQYHGKEITETINEYLCSPLIFASKYVKDAKTKHMKFSIDDFDDLEVLFEEKTNVSNIPNSISFVYCYRFKDSTGTQTMRVCYSHKYKSLDFKKYIEEELPKNDIDFEIVKDICSFGNTSTGQYLVLLKKIAASKQVPKNSTKTISKPQVQARRSES